MNHDFNIGNCDNKDEHQKWWNELLTDNVIAAGYNSELGDQGTNILCHRIARGDWVFAYASQYGYVGIGLAESRDTYKLLDSSIPQPHRRDIQWLYYVESLDDAIPAKEMGVYHPVPAEQTISNDKAETILRAFLQNPKTVIRFK
jgi:hypothetical protein